MNRHQRAADLYRRGYYDEAADLLHELLNENMDDARALFLIGQLHEKAGHFGLAAQLMRRACALAPKQPNPWLGFGTCLLDMHEHEAAEECFQVAVTLAPDDPAPYSNMAAVLVQQGRHNEAIVWANEALQRNPNYWDAIAARGFAELALGRWVDGFRDYDAVSASKYRKTRIYRLPEEPQWDGTPGKTVVLQGEQGLGDEIMFASVVPDAISDCKKVIIDCDQRLEGLFARSFPQADVYGSRRATGLDWPNLYDIDAHLHIGSLGMFYRRNDNDFPRRPYLVADPVRRSHWRKILDVMPGLKIGITWTGGVQQTNRKGRSTTLDDLAPLLFPGNTYVSLQYVDDREDIEVFNASHDAQVTKIDLDDDDYDDTAALVAELDYVITVTTTIAHLCGALGKCAYVLCPAVPHWRYVPGGDHMPWYGDHLTLYRQGRGEQGFGMAINRMRDALMSNALQTARAVSHA